MVYRTAGYDEECPKRPKAPAELAHVIGQIATGGLPNDKDEILNPPPLTSKQRAAYAWAASLTPERRRDFQLTHYP